MTSKSKRLVAVFSIMLALAFMLTACGSSGSEPKASQTAPAADQSTKTDNPGEAKKFRIGFSNGFSGNSWRAEMLASLKQEADKHPEAELIIVDGQGDINKQVNDIESLIAQKVDAIMVIPNTAQSVQPVLKKAMGQGIKVVAFNLLLDDASCADAQVGTDQKYKGSESAKWLSGKLGGKGNVVMLGGIPGNSGTAQYKAGAEEVFKGTEIKVVTYRDCNWQEDKAMAIMADILVSQPKIDGIISDGGQDASGAIKAMLAAKRELVPTTGDDYNGLAKAYVANKDTYKNFDIGIISEPTWESKIAFQTALQLLNGESVEKFVEVKPKIISGEDAAKVAKPNLPDTVFVDTDLDESVLAGLSK